MRGRTTRVNRRYSGAGDARRARNNSGLYVYESAARQLDLNRPMDVELMRERQFRARRNREKAARMNPTYIFFLVLAMSIMACILISYVRILSDITASVDNISRLETTLNDLKHTNDEEYSRIENSVSLDEVKKVAIEQLGMKYASEGQVVLYEAADADYVRQVEDLPKKKK